MKIKSIVKAALPAVVLMSATSAIAGTSTGGAAADFDVFMTTVKDWSQGALGKGLAITMTLMGGAIGVAKNSPMPALTGLGGAAFLSYSPEIIESIFASGAVM